MNEFVIDLGTLRGSRADVVVEGGASDLGLAAEDWPGTARAAISVERTGDRVTVRGELSGTARLECVRCLRTFDADLVAPVMVFADRTGSSDPRDQRELERDDHMLFHDGRQLDLRETFRESLLLEVPITPRCREDCPGLCPKCGADLSEGPCAACSDEGTARHSG